MDGIEGGKVSVGELEWLKRIRINLEAKKLNKSLKKLEIIEEESEGEC